MNAPPLVLPPGLAIAIAQLSAKDQRRVAEALESLHTVNSRLWEAEDQVRIAGSATARVADAKRSIDQWNVERNQLAERADEILGCLATAEPGDAPVHTETLAGALDRLSVLTLRVFHTEQAARIDDLMGRRMPALCRQHRELTAAIDVLVGEVASGRRRLPDGARHKLYGQSPVPSGGIRVEHSIERVIAFGGLSECGKSTSAQYLVDFHGAQRLKIGYLLKQGALRHGLTDPYQLSAERQAELLLEELNRFSEGHHDTSLFTIESVHDPASIAALKALMGDVLQIVYLDAEFEIRAERSGTSPQAVAAKDEVKLSRGAHLVLDLADFVLDNTGGIVELRAWLSRIAQPSANEPPSLPIAIPQPPKLPAAITTATTALVADLHAAKAGIYLAALTGSPNDGTWIPGWSDLDLLVIADHDSARAVSAAVAEYRRNLGTAAPVGLTLVTRDELLARRMVPRLAFALHAIQNGQSVLHRAPGLLLPAVTRTDLAQAAVRELPQVIITLRRLRAEAAPDSLRQLYKHVVLATRLILREHGQWTSGPDTILAAASTVPGLGPIEMPTLNDIASTWCDGPRDRHLPTVTQAADHLLAWYAQQVAA